MGRLCIDSCLHLGFLLKLVMHILNEFVLYIRAGAFADM